MGRPGRFFYTGRRPSRYIKRKEKGRRKDRWCVWPGVLSPPLAWSSNMPLLVWLRGSDLQHGLQGGKGRQQAGRKKDTVPARGSSPPWIPPNSLRGRRPGFLSPSANGGHGDLSLGWIERSLQPVGLVNETMGEQSSVSRGGAQLGRTHPPCPGRKKRKKFHAKIGGVARHRQLQPRGRGPRSSALDVPLEQNSLEDGFARLCPAPRAIRCASMDHPTGWSAEITQPGPRSWSPCRAHGRQDTSEGGCSHGVRQWAARDDAGERISWHAFLALGLPAADCKRNASTYCGQRGRAAGMEIGFEKWLLGAASTPQPACG